MAAVAVNSRDVSAIPQRVNDAAGVLAHRVLVAGTGVDQVKRPAAANAAKLIGVAGHDAADTEDVSVYSHGVMNLVAASAIAVGDYVNVADAEGRVKTVSETAGTQNVVGIARGVATANGQLIKVDLQFHLR
jgi:predicted RecA/RadA family phage recombinase